MYFPRKENPTLIPDLLAEWFSCIAGYYLIINTNSITNTSDIVMGRGEGG
jgi:hypothetical protein